MLVIGLEVIEAALKRHAPARGPVARWLKITLESEWKNIVEVRRTFPTADAIKGTAWTCFNIGGGNYRLITGIFYVSSTVRIEELLTHAEYDKKY